MLSIRCCKRVVKTREVTSENICLETQNFTRFSRLPQFPLKFALQSSFFSTARKFNIRSFIAIPSLSVYPTTHFDTPSYLSCLL